jgi:hypothetical protein
MPLQPCVHGELVIPYILMQGMVPLEMERLLRQWSFLPPTVAQCRWRMDPVRAGWVLEYDVALPGTPQELTAWPSR